MEPGLLLRGCFTSHSVCPGSFHKEGLQLKDVSIFAMPPFLPFFESGFGAGFRCAESHLPYKIRHRAFSRRKEMKGGKKRKRKTVI
jgi:hypothetical protein